MNNTFYLLRHAEPEVDRYKPLNEWDLSAKGRRQAKETALSTCFDDIDVVVSSFEKKAVQTAISISDKLGKKIIRNKELNELNRGDCTFLEAEVYDETIRFALTNLNRSL